MGSKANSNIDLSTSLLNNNLAKQIKVILEVIERVVTFQHGGLNNSVDTMGEVLRSYNLNRSEITVLRSSISEARQVLSQKKKDQSSTALKDLWLQKIEAEESLRILEDLEKLKDAPSQVLKFIQQKRFVSAVTVLNTAIDSMFNDVILYFNIVRFIYFAIKSSFIMIQDLVAVTALDSIRQQLMDIKGSMLDAIVSEIRFIILGTFISFPRHAFHLSLIDS